MINPPDLETLNKLYLELSSIATARTWEQVCVRVAIAKAMDAARKLPSASWIATEEMRGILTDLDEKLKNPSLFNQHCK